MNHGGKRKGSGRKKLSDKKERLVMFIPGSRIETVGLENCKEICKESIEFEYQRIK